MKYQKHLSLFFVVSSILLTAQSKDVTKVESILDKLEEQLLKQEGESFSIKGSRLNAPQEKESSMTFNARSIYADPNSQKRVAELAESVGKLEQQIDSLSAQVHRSKQHVLELSRQGNHVSFNFTTPAGDKAALQHISARIDDFEVYSLEDNAGVWVPNQSASLYSGPLSPGKHELTVSARFALRSADGIPVKTPIIRTVHKTFPVTISGQSKQETLGLEFGLPTSRNGKVTAMLKRETREL